MKKIFIVFLSLFFCSTSFAAPFKQIIFFGDSLSDNGNLYQLIKIFPKSPPYYKGRFSNGPTWAEDVGKIYYDKYYMDYVDYAYGGATAMLHKSASPITLEDELYNYYLNSVFINKSKVLYVFWIGANDYIFDADPDVYALTGAVVNKISWAITSLIDHGAQYFLILNLPDLAKTPFAKLKQSESKFHIITTIHNQKLADEIVKLQNKYPTIKFIMMDVYTTFNDLLTNPDKYNQKYHQAIANVSDACLNPHFLLASDKSDLSLELQKAFVNDKKVDPQMIINSILNSPALQQTYQIGKSYELGNAVPCANPNQYVFWDVLHPTTVVHQMFGEIVVETLANEGMG